MLVETFHAGAVSFAYLWERLITWGCSRYILGAVLHEALEQGGGRR